jgi:hypothetical protein
MGTNRRKEMKLSYIKIFQCQIEEKDSNLLGKVFRRG